ncbi:MAG TPA: hypothetical protein VHE35_14625 [Kofleriaceae bacterium]|nr:hypothetical protein [Kofleriaceae bacterium]
MTRTALSFACVGLAGCAPTHATAPPVIRQVAVAVPRAATGPDLPCAIDETFDDRPGGSRTVNRFDAAHRLIAVDTDLARNGTIDLWSRRSYDAAGHLVDDKETWGELRYELGPDGRVVARVRIEHDGSQIRTTMTYDPLGRVVLERRPEDEVHFEYDPAGRLVNATRFALGTTTVLAVLLREYDAAGHLVDERRGDDPRQRRKHWFRDDARHQVEEVDFDGPYVIGSVVDHHDAAGLRTSEEFLQPDGKQTRQRSFEYDAAGKLLVMTEVEGARRTTTRYTYCDAGGPAIEAELPDEP